MQIVKAFVLWSCCVVFLLCSACERPDDASSKGLNTGAKPGEETTSEFFEQANKALIDGEVDQALSLCEEGLKQGDAACHRLIGIAYKQKKDSPKACAAFEQALANNDPHAITIERYIKHLRCDKVPR